MQIEQQRMTELAEALQMMLSCEASQAKQAKLLKKAHERAAA